MYISNCLFAPYPSSLHHLDLDLDLDITSCHTMIHTPTCQDVSSIKEFISKHKLCHHYHLLIVLQYLAIHFLLDFKSRDYRLPSLLLNKLTPEHISPVSFQHLQALPLRPQMKNKVNDSTQELGLDWQITEVWERTIRWTV